MTQAQIVSITSSPARATTKRAPSPALDPRELLDQVRIEHPRIADAAEAFWQAVRRRPNYLESVVVLWATTQLRHGQAAAAKVRGRREGKAAAEVAAGEIRDRLGAVILLNLPMPSGRTLGDTLGCELTGLAGWLGDLARRVPKTHSVASALSEQQVRQVWIANRGA